MSATAFALMRRRQEQEALKAKAAVVNEKPKAEVKPKAAVKPVTKKGSSNGNSKR